MSLPAWVGAYIGLPFKPLGRDRAGLDCWGLVRLVYAEQFAIELPAYTAGYGDVSPADAKAIAEAVEAGIAPDWFSLPPGAAVPGDAALLRIWGHPLHIGVLVAPGVMLHVDEHINATVERLDTARWLRRLVGCYRHRAATYAV